MPAADCDIAGADIAGADITGVDIAGADVDCDIAGPGLASFEPLQAARAKAVASSAAPVNALHCIWFTLSLRASFARSVVGNPYAIEQTRKLVAADGFVIAPSQLRRPISRWVTQAGP